MNNTQYITNCFPTIKQSLDYKKKVDYELKTNETPFYI